MRNAIPVPALVEELGHLHTAATQINERLTTLFKGSGHLPDSAVPSLNAANRAMKSAVTHLAASQLLCERAGE